jgi:hypothetical protein
MVYGRMMRLGSWKEKIIHGIEDMYVDHKA